MPPSSLIFVVILAVWAAYLMQHWVRRRDHIATARSVDRFSEAMRVLERRQRAPRSDSRSPAPRSYAVSPARPAYPDVVVKRAHQASPGDARSTTATAAPVRAVTAPLSGARGRGTTLLLAGLAMVLGTVLGVLEMWPPWTVGVGIGFFVLTLAVVRTTVRRSTNALPTPLRRSVPEPTRTPVPEPTRAPRRTVADAAGGAAAAMAATEQPTVQAAPARHTAVYDAVYDIDQIELAHRAASQHPTLTTAQRAAPGTWQPVAVPPPTYTLKAKAGARHTGSTAATTRRADTSQDLPFDGYALAFEEESEELPAVHSLG